MSLPLYSSAGYAIIAAAGAIVVIILGFIASLIARSGEMGMTIRRKQMLAFSEVKLEVSFINKTGKNLEFSSICFVDNAKEGLKLISELSDMPICRDDSQYRSVVSKPLGYSILVGKNSSWSGIIDFEIPSNYGYISSPAILMKGSNGRYYLVSFALNFYSTQSSKLKRISKKKSSLKRD